MERYHDTTREDKIKCTAQRATCSSPKRLACGINLSAQCRCGRLDAGAIIHRCIRASGSAVRRQASEKARHACVSACVPLSVPNPGRQNFSFKYKFTYRGVANVRGLIAKLTEVGGSAHLDSGYYGSKRKETKKLKKRREACSCFVFCGRTGEEPAGQLAVGSISAQRAAQRALPPRKGEGPPGKDSTNPVFIKSTVRVRQRTL